MLDRLTIEPPAPPWRVLMRLTASREHSSVPSTLTSSMRLKRASAHLVQARLHVDDAGVVDQRGEAAEAPVDGLEHRHHRGLVGDVGAHQQRAAAERAHLGGHGFGRRGIARVVDGHVVAALGEQPRGGGADAAAGAGDEGDAGRRHGRSPASSLRSWPAGDCAATGSPGLSTGSRLGTLPHRPDAASETAMKRRTLITALPGCLVAPAFVASAQPLEKPKVALAVGGQQPAVLPAADDRRVAGLLQGRRARRHDQRLRRRRAIAARAGGRQRRRGVGRLRAHGQHAGQGPEAARLRADGSRAADRARHQSEDDAQLQDA